MNALSQYAPLIGLLLVIFGICRVLMRSGIEFGRGMNLQTEHRNSVDLAAVWSALFSPTGRVDLGAIVLGVVIILIFIASIG